MTTAPNNEAANETASSEAVPVAGESAVPEFAHSDLVARLIGEAFSGLNSGPRGSKPSVPRSVPVEIPGLSGLPEAAATDAHSGVPPVHPSVPTAAPRTAPPPSAQPEKTPSGAHSPDSGDSYAFGEPRCNGSYRPEGNRPKTKTAKSNSTLGFSDPESLASPDYYFLRGTGASGKSPAACQSYPKNSPPVP